MGHELSLLPVPFSDTHWGDPHRSSRGIRRCELARTGKVGPTWLFVLLTSSAVSHRLRFVSRQSAKPLPCNAFANHTPSWRSHLEISRPREPFTSSAGSRRPTSSKGGRYFTIATRCRCQRGGLTTIGHSCFHFGRSDFICKESTRMHRTAEDAATEMQHAGIRVP